MCIRIVYLMHVSMLYLLDVLCVLFACHGYQPCRRTSSCASTLSEPSCLDSDKYFQGGHVWRGREVCPRAHHGHHQRGTWAYHQHVVTANILPQTPMNLMVACIPPCSLATVVDTEGQIAIYSSALLTMRRSNENLKEGLNPGFCMVSLGDVKCSHPQES